MPSFRNILIIALVSLLAGLCHVVFIAPKGSRSQYRDADESKSDYLKLSVQWGPGFCKTKGCSAPPRFTIHGLWPSRIDNAYLPRNCIGEPEFDTGYIGRLQDRLDSDWPSLIGSNKRFWDLQWTRHGKCTLRLPGFDGVHDYFARSLDLFDHLDLNARDLFTPKNHVDIKRDELVKNLTRYHNKIIELNTGYAGDYYYLIEARFCFTNTLPHKPIDCPGIQKSSTPLRLIS